MSSFLSFFLFFSLFLRLSSFSSLAPSRNGLCHWQKTPTKNRFIPTAATSPSFNSLIYTTRSVSYSVRGSLFFVFFMLFFLELILSSRVWGVIKTRHEKRGKKDPRVLLSLLSRKTKKTRAPHSVLSRYWETKFWGVVVSEWERRDWSRGVTPSSIPLPPKLVKQRGRGREQWAARKTMSWSFERLIHNCAYTQTNRTWHNITQNGKKGRMEGGKRGV